MKKIKILYMIDSLRKGGAEKQFTELINRIDKKKFSVSVCLTLQSGHYESIINKSQLHSFHVFYKNNHLDFFRILFQLTKLIKSLQPSIVHSWLPYSNFLNSVCSIFIPDYKIIIGIRNSPKCFKQGNLFYTFLSNIMFYFTLCKTNLILVNSNQVLRDIHKHYSPKNTLLSIPNGIDINAIELLSNQSVNYSKLNTKEQDYKIVCISRLEKQKGHMVLFKAMKILLQKQLPIKIYIIGKGRLKDHLIQYIQDNHLAQHIFLMGFQENPMPFLKKADAFILPSLYEGMPNALMEAMALKIPVIATDIDGSKELIDHKINGLLIPTNNQHLLVQAIEELYNNQKKAIDLGIKAFNKIQAFQIENIIHQYELTYLNLQNKYKPM